MRVLPFDTNEDGYVNSVVFQVTHEPMTAREVAQVLVECDYNFAHDLQEVLYYLLWEDPGFLSQAQMNEERSGG